MDSGRAALGGLAGPVTSGRGEEGGGKGEGGLIVTGDQVVMVMVRENSV